MFFELNERRSPLRVPGWQRKVGDLALSANDTLFLFSLMC